MTTDDDDALCIFTLIDKADVIVAMWWDAALAFKGTIVCPMVSGGTGEIDMRASTQYVPLMELKISMSPFSAFQGRAKTLVS